MPPDRVPRSIYCVRGDWVFRRQDFQLEVLQRDQSSRAVGLAGFERGSLGFRELLGSESRFRKISPTR